MLERREESDRTNEKWEAKKGFASSIRHCGVIEHERLE
jgi:hypothetical protein